MTQRLENLIMEVTETSTHIDFNSETKILTMNGRSIPANAIAFFDPILKWTKSFLKSYPTETKLNISFEYLHTSAARQVFELIKLLKESEKSTNFLTINWYYEENDEDMKQLGMDFSSVIGMPFKFTPFKN